MKTGGVFKSAKLLQLLLMRELDDSHKQRSDEDVQLLRPKMSPLSGVPGHKVHNTFQHIVTEEL